MDLRILRYFHSSQRTKLPTKAAEQLHITQPTLSRQLGRVRGRARHFSL